jgi:hypothetical protein
MKLLLETAGTMEWEIVDVFNSYEEIDEWIAENYGVTFDEFKKEVEEEDDSYTPTREEWYEEMEIRVRKF